MKIPIQEGLRVEPRPVATPYDNTDKSTGLADVAQGVGQLAAGAQQFDVAQKRAKKQADDFRADDAYLKFGRADNDAKYAKDTGFLNQLGEKGLDSHPTLEALDKQRQAISDGLANDDQRRSFNLKAGAKFEQTRAEFESHSAKQRLNVYQNVATGAQQLALDTATADPSQVDSAVGKVLVDPDGSPGPLRRALLAHGMPSEQIAAVEQKFKADTYQAAIQSYISAKDYHNAEAAFTKYEGQLGPAAKQLKATIATLRQDIEGEATAMKLTEAARDPANGRVDSAKAIASLDTLPEGPLKDAARTRLEHRVTESDKAWKKEADGHYDKAMTGYLALQSLAGVNSTEKAWLQQNDLAGWNKIVAKSQADARARAAAGIKETDEQRQALVALRADMAANPEKYRDMDAPAFTAEWADKLSDGGYKEAGRIFAATKKESKGTAAEFTRFLNDEVRGNTALKTKEDQAQFKAFMGDRRREFLAEHKREPNLDEMEQMRAKTYEARLRPTWLSEHSFGLVSPTSEPAYKADAKAKADALKTGAAVAPAAAPAKPASATAAAKVEVINDKGERKNVPAGVLDAWLARNKGWRKR